MCLCICPALCKLKEYVVFNPVFYFALFWFKGIFRTKNTYSLIFSNEFRYLHVFCYVSKNLKQVWIVIVHYLEEWTCIKSVEWCNYIPITGKLQKTKQRININIKYATHEYKYKRKQIRLICSSHSVNLVCRRKFVCHNSPISAKRFKKGEL